MTDQRIDYCLKREQGLIAWDWDGTLSANGVEMLERCKPIINHFQDHYKWYSIVVSARHESPPINFVHTTILGYPGVVIWNEGKVNAYRFKFYVLRKLFSKGKGVLRLYIDNQSDLLEAFNLSEPDIPVSDCGNFDPLQLVRAIEVHKKLLARRHQSTDTS